MFQITDTIAADTYDVSVTRSLSEDQPRKVNFRIGEKVSGTIYLITERPPCPNCEGVIKQFREMFPDIKLIVESMY